MTIFLNRSSARTELAIAIHLSTRLLEEGLQSIQKRDVRTYTHIYNIIYNYNTYIYTYNYNIYIGSFDSTIAHSPDELRNLLVGPSSWHAMSHKNVGCPAKTVMFPVYHDLSPAHVGSCKTFARPQARISGGIRVCPRCGGYPTRCENLEAHNF